MQFEPELYPVGDYKFIASSSLGVVAREYEIAQLTQLLQTMGDDNPIKIQLTEAIIDNMSLSNREVLLAAMQQIRQANQPDPQVEQQKQQLEQLAAQTQLEFQRSQANALNSQAQESSARAAKLEVETLVKPKEIEIDRLKAITTNLKAGTEDDKEFERRIKISEQLLKERDIAVKEQNTQPQQPQQPVEIPQPQQPAVTPIRSPVVGIS